MILTRVELTMGNSHFVKGAPRNSPLYKTLDKIGLNSPLYYISTSLYKTLDKVGQILTNLDRILHTLILFYFYTHLSTNYSQVIHKLIYFYKDIAYRYYFYYIIGYIGDFGEFSPT